MERATGEAQWKLTDLKWQPAQPQPGQTVYPSLRFQLPAAQKWECLTLQLNHKLPAPGTAVSTEWRLRKPSVERDAVYWHAAQVEADSQCGLCKGNSVNEKDVCGWENWDGMRQLYPHVYLLRNDSDCLFVHFRPLEKNQPTSYRWRDYLSYSRLKLFLTGLLVIHIPQWHKSTWKTLWPWVWNSSMWQWHTEQSVMLFKIKLPHL